MDVAIYRELPETGRWVMSDFTYKQFKGNLEEMRKLLNEVLDSVHVKE